MSEQFSMVAEWNHLMALSSPLSCPLSQQLSTSWPTTLNLSIYNSRPTPINLSTYNIWPFKPTTLEVSAYNSQPLDLQLSISLPTTIILSTYNSQTLSLQLSMSWPTALSPLAISPLTPYSPRSRHIATQFLTPHPDGIYMHEMKNVLAKTSN